MNRKISALICMAALSLAAVRPAAGSSNGSNPPSPAEDGTLPALAAVAGAGTMETHTYEYLERKAGVEGLLLRG